MKKHLEATPFMEPADFGRSLTGFSLNILVSDMPRAVEFAGAVLQAQFRYADADIAIAFKGDFQWLIHSDHTYNKHPLLAHSMAAGFRGAGAEFRLHNGDPDKATQIAQQLGFKVFDGPRDQPAHGLREVHIQDQDNYMWVIDAPLLNCC